MNQAHQEIPHQEAPHKQVPRKQVPRKQVPCVDVAIIGAGLVGQSLAAALSQDDDTLQIALLDPAFRAGTAPEHGTDIDDFDLQVSALTARTQDFLTHIGAWQHLPRERARAYHFMDVWDAEGTGRVHFDAADLHAPCLGHIVENRQTLWAIQQQLENAHNVKPIPVAVNAIDNMTPEGFTPVWLANGDTLHARLVVGADGAHSRVRQWVGLPTREWNYDHHAIVATVKTEHPLQATAWQRFRPEGPLAFLPMPEDEHLASIVWSTTPDEAETLMALNKNAFCTALGQAFEQRLGSIVDCSERAAFPLRQRHAKRYWTDGVVVAGDAAHTIHPLAGQGVNLGFKDVEVLAEEIIKAHQRGLSPGHASVLSRYQRRREADNLTTMAVMESFKRLFGADLPAIRLLRNAGMRQFDRLLPLKQHAMMTAMGL